MRVEVSVPITVRYSETDQMRVAYHVHYLIWFNVARDALLNKIGIDIRKGEALGYLSPVTEIFCKYKYPARYGDDLVVKAWTELTKFPKFKVFYELVHKKTRRLLAEGGSVNVLTTKELRLLVQYPDDLRDIIVKGGNQWNQL